MWIIHFLTLKQMSCKPYLLVWQINRQFFYWNGSLILRNRNFSFLSETSKNKKSHKTYLHPAITVQHLLRHAIKYKSFLSVLSSVFTIFMKTIPLMNSFPYFEDTDSLKIDSVDSSYTYLLFIALIGNSFSLFGCC